MGCCGNSSTTLGNGKTRTCTDILWLCIFILFWFLMIFIAAFAFVYGNPLRLINGYDSFGNTCGTKFNEKMGGLTLSGLDTSDKQYLFFVDVTKVKQSLKICVKKCPDKNLENIRDVQEFYKNTNSNLCRYDFDFKNLDDPKWTGPDDNLAVSSPLGPCPPFPVYNSIPVLNRCIPRPVKDLTEQILSNLYSVLNSWDLVEQVLSDIYATWREILILMLLAFVLSLFMVGILHFLSSIVAWIFMVAISIAAIAGTVVLWWTYVDIKHALDHTPQNQMLQESIQNERAFLVYSIIATVITVILLLLVWTVRKSVGRMSKLFEESASCLADLPMLFLQPFFTFAALLAFLMLWVFVVVCLATSSYAGSHSYFPFSSAVLTGDPNQKISQSFSETTPHPLNISLTGIKSFTWMEFVEPTWVRYMWWVYLIGLVWISEFILSCQQMVIAGAVAEWYFSRKNGGKGSVLTSMSNLICYHLGTVAKGSFLITLFKLPRLILTYIDIKLRAAKEKGSSCASCLVRSCICCLYCFEKFIKFMNHNAYTVVAMEGHGFCTSAKIAWDALVSNALDLLVINSVGDFILFLGKCIVTALTASMGLIYLKTSSHLHFYAVPTIVVCVFAFFIAHAVLTLYEIVIDTLFLCSCEDRRLGTTEEMRVASSQSHELTPMHSH